jgi:broad specificity phosphatase PhoE
VSQTAERRDRLEADATIRSRLGHEVFLVRHAPTAWTGVRWCGRADPPLTAEGRRMARAVADRLAPWLDATSTVFASPARRTRATAEAIAQSVALPITWAPDLLEVDVGAVEGLAWSDVEARFPDLAARLAAGERIDWPGGEAWMDVVARARRAADRVRVAAESGSVVVVSHGGLLHALTGELAADPFRAIPPFGAGAVLRLEPASS